MSRKPICVCVWSITYSETVDNPLCSQEKFQSALDNLDPAGYIFQLEKGKEAGKLHFQCNLRLKQKMAMSDLRKSLKSILREFWGEGCMTLRPTHDTKKADFYCMKEETRVPGTRPCVFPRNIYIGQDLPSKFYPWQKIMYHNLQQPPDDRNVTLICDPSGNKGKSVFAKTLAYRYDACVIPLGLSSAQMKSAIVSAGPKRIYILDLPRNNKSFQDIFDTIEEIKRGFVISSFQGKFKEMFMERPHIVCFTNQYLDLGYLSFDMWQLYKISSSYELEHVDKYAIQLAQKQEEKDNKENMFSSKNKKNTSNK